MRSDYDEPSQYSGGIKRSRRPYPYLFRILITGLGLWFVLFVVPHRTNSSAGAEFWQTSYANLVELKPRADNSLRARVSAYSPGQMTFESCRQVDNY
jgi:hypothetical protein